MSRRIYPHSRISEWRCYDIDDICSLYKNLGLHPQTVRAWVKQGLPTIDQGKPMLIFGQILKTFLKSKNDKYKCPVSENEFYCFKCQDAKRAYQRQVSVFFQKEGCMRLQSVCCTCKTHIYKTKKRSHYPMVMRIFNVIEVERLNDFAPSSCKTHLRQNEKEHKSESMQGELF